jgi:hypothetical protein
MWEKRRWVSDMPLKQFMFQKQQTERMQRDLGQLLPHFFRSGNENQPFVAA